MSQRSQRAAAEVRASLARSMVSQRALARHLRISESSLSRRLRGATPFSIDELAAIAELLEVDLTELLGSGRAAS